MTAHEDILVFSKAPLGHKSLLGEKRMTYNPQGLVQINKIYKVGKNKFGSIQGIRKGHKESILKEFTNYPTDILKGFKKDKENLHPTQKPVALLEYLIKTYTNENDTVLDNCMGSGSTGVACVNTKRNFIGFELDPKYFEIAKKRMENDIYNF